MLFQQAKSLIHPLGQTYIDLWSTDHAAMRSKTDTEIKLSNKKTFEIVSSWNNVRFLVVFMTL